MRDRRYAIWPKRRRFGGHGQPRAGGSRQRPPGHVRACQAGGGEDRLLRHRRDREPHSGRPAAIPVRLPAAPAHAAPSTATLPRRCVRRREDPDCEIELRIEFLDDLSPQNSPRGCSRWARECDAVGVVAAVHPWSRRRSRRCKPAQRAGVCADLAALGDRAVHYVGLDNWKVGRTAAWAIEQSAVPGKLGILVGNHRYRCQEMNESGFRSYFREHAPDFTLLEPLLDLRIERHRAGNDREAAERASGPRRALCRRRRHLRRHRRTALHRPRRQVVVVGYELMDFTRTGSARRHADLRHLASLGPQVAEKALAGMVRAVSAPNESGNFTTILPFEITRARTSRRMVHPTLASGKSPEWPAGCTTCSDTIWKSAQRPCRHGLHLSAFAIERHPRRHPWRQRGGRLPSL